MKATSLQSLAGCSCAQARGAAAIDPEGVRELLALLPGWAREGDEIVKTYALANYHETLAFVNAIAWIAHRQDHHPDLSVHYNRCRVAFSTHAVRGLTENDFICAAKVETLWAA